MITREEWKRTAEHAAAAKHGEKNYGWYAFRQYGAVPVGIAVAAGAVGLGAWWMWSNVIRPLFDHDTPGPAGGLPDAFWVITVIALVATLIAFRPGRKFAMLHVLLAKVAVTALVWLGLFGYAIAYIST